jgi:hypothetical protein
MVLRTYMTFDAPVTESVSDEVPVGRGLACSLLEGALRQRLELVEAVEQHESYGWSFVLEGEKDQPVWCLLQCSDAWLVITRPQRSLRAQLFSRFDPRSQRSVCEALHAAALMQREISKVRWFTESEFLNQQPGSNRP